MNEARNLIIETINEAKKPYNEKLSVAIELSYTKGEFLEIAQELEILDFLTDALEQENQDFDGWLESFGIDAGEVVS